MKEQTSALIQRLILEVMEEATEALGEEQILEAVNKKLSIRGQGNGTTAH